MTASQLHKALAPAAHSVRHRMSLQLTGKGSFNDV